MEILPPLFAASFTIVSFLAYCSALKMEAASK
jgi:hypothetical protein